MKKYLSKKLDEKKLDENIGVQFLEQKIFG